MMIKNNELFAKYVCFTLNQNQFFTELSRDLVQTEYSLLFSQNN